MREQYSLDSLDCSVSAKLFQVLSIFFIATFNTVENSPRLTYAPPILVKWRKTSYSLKQRVIITIKKWFWLIALYIFHSFRQGTYKEYLSLVSLSTDPPQVCHGHGPTKSASRDQAALTALRTLSKLGLDSVTNSGSKKDKSSANANDAGNMHVYGQQVKTNNVINGAMDK